MSAFIERFRKLSVCVVFLLTFCRFELRNHAVAAGQTSSTDSCDSQHETVMLSDDRGIRGHSNFADTGISTFLGIPYALPPTGDRRFSTPEPTPPWTGVLDALNLSRKCLQSFEVSEDESEDCLYLNVFTPSTSGSSPVMVWIHGGGFFRDSGNNWDGTRLAGKGVVIVTFNYRFSIFGFATTHDDVLPGNLGLLDQITVLRWVQDNIHVFGGDPKQVTLFGHSIGSTSISLHMMSPLSEGLFHRAILDSGSSFSIWALERAKSLPSLKQNTMKVAEAFNCTKDGTSASLLACMRKPDAHSILREVMKLQMETQTFVLFYPRVEDTFGFLPDFPEKLLDAGKFQNMETLSGFASGEASSIIYGKFGDVEGISRLQFQEGIREVFTWYSYADEDKIAEKMADFYLEDVTDPKDVISKLYEAANDLLQLPQLIQLQKILRHQTQPNEHHMFQIDYVPSTILDQPKSLGLPHYREHVLIFHSDANTSIFTFDNLSTNLSKTDKEVADKIQHVLTSFAKYGAKSFTIDPVPNQDLPWPAYTLFVPLLGHIDVNFSLTEYTKEKEVDLYLDFIKFIGTPSPDK